MAASLFTGAAVSFCVENAADVALVFLKLFRKRTIFTE